MKNSWLHNSFSLFILTSKWCYLLFPGIIQPEPTPSLAILSPFLLRFNSISLGNLQNLYFFFICIGVNYKVAENWTTHIQVLECSTYCRYSTCNVSSFFTPLHTAWEIWFRDHHFWHKHIFPVSVKTGVQPQRYKWFHSYVMRFHCTCHFYSSLFSSDIFPESPISDQHFSFSFFLQKTCFAFIAEKHVL